MARKGENIYKRKDGRWEGRWIISHECGKAKYGYIYAKTYSEVRTELSFRRQNGLTHKISSGKKLKSYYSNWIELIQLNRKESTCVKYRSIIEKHILPSFGELLLCQEKSQNKHTKSYQPTRESEERAKFLYKFSKSTGERKSQ